MERQEIKVYVGLVHSPVYNKLGDKITTTITNLDLHDIARAGRTYGIAGYYVINPLKSQQNLARRMQKYWTSDYGADYNSNRNEAFSVLRIASTLDEVLDEIKEETQHKPLLVSTSARERPNSVSFLEMREKIFNEDKPFLLLFGTGWGLTENTLSMCDYMLEPIYGRGEFNHLSVRSAASIILDRLLSKPWWK